MKKFKSALKNDILNRTQQHLNPAGKKKSLLIVDNTSSGGSSSKRKGSARRSNKNTKTKMDRRTTVGNSEIELIN